MRIAVSAVLAAVCFGAAACADPPPDFMLKLTFDGRQIEGKPLTWDSHLVRLLGRDGRLWEFPPDKATDFSKSADRFRSYSPSEFRAELLRELGKEFEVTGTGHYLVAHPRGQRDKWAQRFEDLYRSFVHYFSVRGFRPVSPPFPLIGVVCKDRSDFHRYTASLGRPVPPGVLGFYELDSNRIILYDIDGGRDSQNWQETASVIIHEAAHQTAFNTGVHGRYAPPPLWVVEGLATTFEAPGVYDSRHHTQQADRINRDRFEYFKQRVAPKHKTELLLRMIASDGLFRSNPSTAYAEAWALSFYLVETQPRKYAKYLAMTAKQPPFGDCTASQRTADFTSVFGDDWPMLEARLLRFMEGLK
ncbi:MAG TPA: DUF1570 domain-containing protein [Thermoguttaceae bacterium]|nr:DUF1570 domain-containing protein [Thermoguttaceae bacterium]